MTFTPTPLSGSYVISLEPVEDERGWFVRTYCQDAFRSIAPALSWVQCNHSHTRLAGSLRGLHFQRPPHAEAKLIRCIAGAVWDVIVDLRRESPTFLQWFGLTLSPAARNMLFVPERFAHGFQTLEDGAEMLYQHTHAFVPDSEGGLRYDDPRLGIRWPLPVRNLSARDRGHPLLDDAFEGL